MSTLTEYEVEELLRLAPPKIRPHINRLLEELRELREQQSNREFLYSHEVPW